MIETNTQLLQKIEQKLKTNQIGFWIENQDCYLWENTFHYSNKIKVGNLSQTRENYYFQLLEEVKKLGEARSLISH